MTPPLVNGNVLGSAVTSQRSPDVAVIGGGPGGLLAAEVLATAGAAVTVYERMPSVGRKLLLAGRGGLNLTHTEPYDTFVSRYGAASPVIGPTLSAFSPQALRAWCAGLGQETFVGSSRRVFPAGFRATPLLRAWLSRLRDLGVQFQLRSEWRGWDDRNGLLMANADGVTHTVRAAAVVFALGGGSWPRSGSNGAWAETFARDAGIEIVPLRPANCGFTVAWTAPFRDRFAGTPIKNVRLTFADISTSGELLVTAAGLEGGAIYALSGPLRDAIDRHGVAVLQVDLAPDRAPEALSQRLVRSIPPGASRTSSTLLRDRSGLRPAAIGLVREVTQNHLPGNVEDLARLLKALPLPLHGVQPLDRAISTAGGVALHEIDEFFMLRRRPGCFVAGEMLDWEAPTGGYLLQATFSTAVAAANGALRWLGLGLGATEAPTISEHGPC